MKVLNLLCSNDHRFEGWFGSDDDFQTQHARGLLECPLCGDAQVTRLPSAPRLNVLNRRDDGPEAPSAAPAPSPQQVMQAQVLRAVRHMMDNTEDVGERFPEEARRIHYGEVEERGIRGRATRAEAEALAEEGIDVVAVAVPESMKGPSH